MFLLSSFVPTFESECIGLTVVFRLFVIYPRVGKLMRKAQRKYLKINQLYGH